MQMDNRRILAYSLLFLKLRSILNTSDDKIITVKLLKRGFWLIILMIFSIGCISGETPVQTTSPPITTVAPTTTVPPITTVAPTTTTPPTTTPAPTTTTPPTTTPAPTTTTPPTTTPAPTTPPPPKPTLEILNQQETYGSGGQVYVGGEVKNNWDKEVFNVQISAILYDKNGKELANLKSSPIEKLTPGASKSFLIRSEILKTHVDHYTLEASSPSITTTTSTNNSPIYD